MIITTAGGRGRGVVAVDAATGEIAWQSQDFQNGYSSPLLDRSRWPARRSSCSPTARSSGSNPKTGALEWTVAHASDQGVNVATPVWGGDHLLFVSSAYNGGSRVLRLRDARRQASTSKRSGRTGASASTSATPSASGNRIYASNGDFGAAPFAAIDVATGDMVWRDRSVSRATIIGVGNKLLILDEDGTLALATPGDAGLVVHAKASMLGARAWTAPTLSGTTLYLRDLKQIVALELGK